MIPHVRTLPDLARTVSRVTMRPAVARVGRLGMMVHGASVCVTLPADAGSIVADLAGFAPGWDAGAVVRVERLVAGRLVAELWAVVADCSTIEAWGNSAREAQWLIGGPL